MVRNAKSDGFVSVELGTVTVRDAVMLLHGWFLAKKKGVTDMSLVLPVQPVWPSSFRLLSQHGAIDELPMDTLTDLVRRATGLTFKVEGRNFSVHGLSNAEVAELAEVIHHHVNRNAVDGMKAVVGIGALVNAGTSVPVFSWLLDLELVELLGIEAFVGPCCWAWGVTLPLLAIQLLLFTGRLKPAT